MRLRARWEALLGRIDYVRGLIVYATDLEGEIVRLSREYSELAIENDRLRQPDVIAMQKTRLVPRAHRSNWEAYAAKWEREHGPMKAKTPVQIDGIMALKRAKEEINAS